jgi:hypothetical protein
MSAVAIGADRIFGDISAVFALPARPFLAKGFHIIRFPVALLMTLLAHGLDFTASVIILGKIDMTDVKDTIVSSCVVRDTRPRGLLPAAPTRIGRRGGRRKPAAGAETTAIMVKTGEGNFITNNIFSGRVQIAPHSARVMNNLKK